MSAAPGEETVVAAFANTPAYHRTSQWRALSCSPLRMASYFVWAIWLAYFLAFLLTLHPARVFSGATLQKVILLVVGVLIAFNVTPAIRIRRAQPAPPLLDAPVTWRFTAARVASDIGDWVHRDFAWQVLHSVDVLPDGLFIAPNPQMRHWIPKAAFENGAAYQQVVTWAQEKADTVRHFSGARAAEWIASLLLIPFALPLPWMAWLLSSPEVSLPDSFPMVEAAYTSATLHYAVGYWVVAAVGYVVLGLPNIRNPFFYIVVALALGTLWDSISPPTLAVGGHNMATWIAGSAAWLVAGWMHWWMVVRNGGDFMPSRAT